MGKATEERRLTHKQRLFVEYYLGRANGNATEAARLAGYSDPEQSGWENKKKQEIQDRISRRYAEAALPADEVLARLGDQARGSLADFIEITEGGGWKINLKRAEEAGKLHLLAELGYTEHGPKLKLHDAQAALVHIGRHHKLFTDRADLTSGEQPLTGYVVIPAPARDDRDPFPAGAGETGPEPAA